MLKDVDLLNPKMQKKRTPCFQDKDFADPSSGFNIHLMCEDCPTVLCQPSGARLRLTEGCSYRRNYYLKSTNCQTVEHARLAD
ncbi:hypothetical protein LXL04_023392 [Taraxacum kok-saghyz]